MTDEIVIDVTTKGGVRGRILRLCEEYTMKAAALRMTAMILDEDDRQTAQQVLPKKIERALAHRTPAKLPKAERLAQVSTYLAEHPGALTREVAEALGMISSKVRTLLLQVATAKKHGRGPTTKQYWTLKAAQPATRTTTTKATTIRRASRAEIVERRAKLVRYLTTHPGVDTHQVGAHLGISRSEAFKLVRTLADGTPGVGRAAAMTWVLKKGGQ